MKQQAALRDSTWKQSFRRRLLAWYAKHKRDLPWRRSSNAYRVWVSEVMLQQTQVETVKPYFNRFMKEFPTVKKLAFADEQEVLKLWEGLGYYRRARGLHAAAKEIIEKHSGRFPHDVETLQTLPGIGRYTAGAIASIAYDQRTPILEANTIRLFARLLGYREDPTKAAGQKLLWEIAEEVLPQKNIADFNQALMELGSLICKPVQPFCKECPVAAHCEAQLAGAQASIPLTKKKMRFVDVNEAAIVIWKQGKVLVRQCGAGERWAGLWDFPRFPIESEGPLFVVDELATKVQKQTGLTIGTVGLLTTLKHGVTRYRITLDCYSATHVSGRLRTTKTAPARWIDCAELSTLPLNTTGRKLAKLVLKRSNSGSIATSQ